MLGCLVVDVVVSFGDRRRGRTLGLMVERMAMGIIVGLRQWGEGEVVKEIIRLGLKSN